MRPTRVPVLAAALFSLAFGLCLPATVSAASITYLLQPFAVGGAVSGDELPTTVETLTSAFGTGTGAVRARHGFIGAFAEASGRFDVLTSILFQDQLTVVSDTLPFGTPIDFDLRMAFSWVPPTATGAADATIQATFGLSTVGVPESLALTQLFVSAADGITLENTTATLQTTVGAVLRLTANLNVSASAGNCCQTGVARADAFNTLGFYVDPSDSTFSYTSETGAGYFSPTAQTAVPEPSTLGLLALGLGQIARLRRRAKVSQTKTLSS
jgi:hypothetical protein